MEQKKSFRKVRCVNPKTNAIKYIPEHLVDELCLTYGLVEQDLPEKEEKLVIPVVVNGKEARPIVIEDTTNEAKTLREQYEELTGKKAGNRKDETLLKELETFNK